VAISTLRNNGGIETLRKCSTLKERHTKLVELVPDYSKWDLPIAKQEFLFSLQHGSNIDLGVCESLFVDEHKQRCQRTGNECSCVIPQSFCTFRDPAGRPKYPEFASCIGVMR